MEADSWGCVQTSPLPYGPGGLPGLWHPDILHGPHYHRYVVQGLIQNGVGGGGGGGGVPSPLFQAAAPLQRLQDKLFQVHIRGSIA